ncbi:MAG: 23S rRNA (uracil(1939)-C(5))-methyltransferase RlmD [Acutalibacteraceae bacterium]|nr:23S rRNA (uracil(1939)-C(5))-methyltransferase RlmD [Acutalibacteraceae bacterium]
MQKNDEIEIVITDMTDEGSGIGRYEGMAVFVPRTAVGDRVRVLVLKVKKTYAFGKLLKVIDPSPDRTENDCPSFNRCGGCVYRHISYQAECRIKQTRVYEAVKRIGGADLKPKEIIASESPERYRNKAQYPVAVDGTLGFYAFHSHRIIPCGKCALQPVIFDEIGAVVTDWIRENCISVYNEEMHKGLLRHIYLRLAEKTGEIMAVAVINGESLPFADDLINRLLSVCGENLKSVQLNINREKTNVILGDKCRVLYGGEYITDVLCGVKVRLSPLSFYQVNRATAEKLYSKAAEYTEPDGKTVLDLYCGAGTIGLSMAKKAKQIIGAEIVPQAIEDAKYNARLNGIENAEFLCADASRAAELLSERGLKPEVVIVDPPRKGCSPELINTITEDFRPQRVVYVSCDPATLARDIKLFSEKGYSLIEYTPVDMFPRTSHVETVALLGRQNSDINS